MVEWCKNKYQIHRTLCNGRWYFLPLRLLWRCGHCILIILCLIHFMLLCEVKTNTSNVWSGTNCSLSSTNKIDYILFRKVWKYWMLCISEILNVWVNHIVNNFFLINGSRIWMSWISICMLHWPNSPSHFN